MVVPKCFIAIGFSLLLVSEYLGQVSEKLTSVTVSNYCETISKLSQAQIWKASYEERDNRSWEPWLTSDHCGILNCAIVQEEKKVAKPETIFDRIIRLESYLFEVPQVPRTDEKISLKRQRINIGDTELYVAEDGKGVPVVLVNGGPGNSHHSFLPHFGRAASFSRVIYYDQRGTGLSDYRAGAKGYSFIQAVDDLDKLRESLGIKKWVVLGHSYGGTLAQAYALKYSQNTAGLVLVGSAVPFGLDVGSREYDFLSEDEVKRIQQIYSIDGNAVVPAHNDRVNLPTLQKMIFNGFLNGDWKRQQITRPTMERMAQIALYEWVHDKNFNRIVGREASRLNLRDAFLQAPIPTLIMEGKWDIVFGPDKSKLFHSQHPNAKQVIFENSSHFPFQDEPDKFFKILGDFVRDLPEVSAQKLEKWHKGTDAQRALLVMN